MITQPRNAVAHWLIRFGKRLPTREEWIVTARGDDLTRIGFAIGLNRELDAEFRKRVLERWRLPGVRA